MDRVASLTLRLSVPADRELTPAYALGPSLQGFLMETIDPEVAGSLHGLDFNPYSQRCFLSEGTLVWRITTFSSHIEKAVITPLLNLDSDSISLRYGGGLELLIIDRTLEATDPSAWTRAFYQEAPPQRSIVEFLTPTAFRSGGKYVFQCDLRLLFQNLAMRYSTLEEGDKEVDEDLIGELAAHTDIASYSLRSQYYPLKGSKIPAFMGKVTLRHGGPQTLRAFTSLLLAFGNWSGVGIKTSMGMGAIAVTHSPAKLHTTTNDGRGLE